MKKSIWLAIIGAAALTGCQSEVMQEREYVPAPREDVEATKPAADPSVTNLNNNQPAVEPVQTHQAPAAQEFQPMRGNFSDEGVSDTGKSGRSGKRGKGARNARSAQNAGPGEYVVKAGDTPEKIARKHHVRLSELMKANNLTEESAKRLRVGQKLVIPERRSGGNAGRRGAAAAAPSAGPGEYIVKSGDTPEKIARKHHVRLSELMKANNLTEEGAKRLRVGQKLVIPGGRSAGNTQAAPVNRGGSAPSAGAEENPARQETLARTEVDGNYEVTVPRDMSVAEFAKLNGVSVEQLRELNPDMPDRLQKDNLVTVPKN